MTREAEMGYDHIKVTVKDIREDYSIIHSVKGVKLFCPIGCLHCRHIGVQNKRKLLHIVCKKMEVKSQRRKILMFRYTNMAAMTSHANHQ